jgi:hypothetical protein
MASEGDSRPGWQSESYIVDYIHAFEYLQKIAYDIHGVDTEKSKKCWSIATAEDHAAEVWWQTSAESFEKSLKNSSF